MTDRIEFDSTGKLDADGKLTPEAQAELIAKIRQIVTESKLSVSPNVMGTPGAPDALGIEGNIMRQLSIESFAVTIAAAVDGLDGTLLAANQLGQSLDDAGAAAPIMYTVGEFAAMVDASLHLLRHTLRKLATIQAWGQRDEVIAPIAPCPAHTPPPPPGAN